MLVSKLEQKLNQSHWLGFFKQLVVIETEILFERQEKNEEKTFNAHFSSLNL